MKRNAFILTVLCIVLAVVQACNKPYKGDFDNVMIYYGGGYNNLSSAIKKNINELCHGAAIPGLRSHDAVVSFCHNVASEGDYTTPSSPVIVRIYKDRKDNIIRDTVQVYPPSTRSIDESTMTNALFAIKDKFPAKHYGMVFSSHATGWIPPGYSHADEGTRTSTFSKKDKEALPHGVYKELPVDPSHPETKSIGAQFYNSRYESYQMELAAFARAIPFHLDYIIFDACLMGCIEVAYELKDVCSYLVMSPTEILKQGMIYEPMAAHLLRNPADLKAICEDYYEYYSTEASTKAASIALVDCSKLGTLAADMAGIIASHRDGLENIDKNRVQKYFYTENQPKHWFYDLRDIAVHIGATPYELEKLDADLASAVMYKAATPTFFDLRITEFSGLSMYIPTSSWNTLNNYYKTLSWNNSVHLVK